MLEGENSAELTNLIGAGNPNRVALPYIRQELLQIEAIFPKHAKLFELQAWGRMARRRLDALWLEVKID
jgi:spermidine/putrescine transport system substrate-binding protein